MKSLLSVDEALSRMCKVIAPLEPEHQPLANCLGRVLTESVRADVDSPPFDKALMDGYAIVSSDIAAGRSVLEVVEELTAGRVSERVVQGGQAVRIMTGAPVPDGADAVVRSEDTERCAERASAECVKVLIRGILPGQNIAKCGTSMRAGQQVLPAGRKLRPQELAALAEMGQPQLSIRPKPRIAVLATGDELVPVSAVPGPGQIRNSNETMLVAQVIQSGGEPVPLGIARDEREHLRGLIAQGLDHDLLLLSGGVSAGKLDLVPSELASAGVEQVFHQVSIKPGKPLWFGVLKRPQRPCYVFGLPGNPVSSMVCFELFVRTAIRRLTGEEPFLPQRYQARLAHAHSHRDNRDTYFPAAVWNEQGQTTVRLMRWHGSSDLQATVDANAMAVLPGTAHDFVAGELVDVISW